MANNNVSIHECENIILVTNIPRSISRNKLEIHFQKSKFGGGDVVSVVYPKSNEEPDCAVVEFRDSSSKCIKSSPHCSTIWKAMYHG